MWRHGVQWAMGSGAEGMGLRHRHKSPANWVLLDIQHTVLELLLGHDLALVEAAHPSIHLAFQAEGEAPFDELHGFLKRNVPSGRNQSVEMVRHNDERVQVKFPLRVIVEYSSLKQFRRGRDSKKAAALRRNSGHEIRPSFLWRKPHFGSITEKPVAKAPFIAA